MNTNTFANKTRNLGENTKHTLRKMVLLSGLTCMGALLPSAASGQAMITISGLSGADHWAWIEAEGSAYITGSGSRVFRNNTSLSGTTTSEGANVYQRATGSSDVRSASWNVYSPAEMSENTRIYSRAMVNTTAGMTLRVGGVIVTPEGAQMVSPGVTNPTAYIDWQVDGTSIGNGITIGERSAGETFTLQYSGASYSSSGLNTFRLDGILIYDGESPVLRSSLNDGNDNYWLRNPGSSNSPVLSDPVTPLFNIAGLGEGNVIHYFLNGAAYTPGTEIGPGNDYELVIAVFASSDPGSQRLAFAGANFSIIPEPEFYGALMAFLFGGMILWRRRNCRIQD